MRLRGKIAQVNKITAKLGDGKSVRVLDIGPKFVDASGNIDAAKDLYQGGFFCI